MLIRLFSRLHDGPFVSILRTARRSFNSSINSPGRDSQFEYATRCGWTFGVVRYEPPQRPASYGIAVGVHTIFPALRDARPKPERAMTLSELLEAKDSAVRTGIDC